MVDSVCEDRARGASVDAVAVIRSPGVKDGTGGSASGGMPWDGGESMAVLRALGTVPSAAAVPPASREEVMTGRRLHHPGRGYLLSIGSLEAAMDLGHWLSQDWFRP